MSTEIKNKVENNEDFACLVCGVHFSEEKQFYGHLRIHTGEVSWSCSQCPNSNVKFNSQSRLRVHENMCHNVIRPYKCQQCSLEFDRASQLAYHKRSVHLGEKSHICQICEKGFFRKTDLRTHLNIHLGTNVCICEVCGRKFNHVSNLIRHCRTHAGIKPYPCTTCGKRFTQISSLVRHKRIHEKAQHSKKELRSSLEVESCKNVLNRKIVKRQHYCKICGQSFKFILLLRQHEKEHDSNANIVEYQSNKMKIKDAEEQNYNSEAAFDLPSKVIQTHSYLNHIAIPPLETDATFSEQTNLAYVTLENHNQDRNVENTLCITSEQLEQISLEKMDDVEIRLPEERVLELVGNINSLEMPLDRVANVNISEILSICNSEADEALSNDNTKLKVLECSKHRNYLDNATEVIYIQCKTGANTEKCQMKVIKGDVSKCEKSKDIGDVCKEACVTEKKKKNVESQSLVNVQCSSNDNCTIDALSNCKLAFQETDCLPSIRTDEMESFECNNLIFDQDKSAMRLVQIENGPCMGQQFYELIMNSLSEKALGASSPRNPEKDIEDAINACKDFVDEPSSLKFEGRQVLQEFEFFKSGTQTSLESYENSSFDSLQPNGYAEQLLEFENSEKGEHFFGLVDDGEARDDLLQSDHVTDDDGSSKNKGGATLESNALDFLICVIDNVEPQSDGDEIGQRQNEKDCKSAQPEGAAETETVAKKKNVKKFHCTVCNKSYSTGYNFKQHIGTHFAEQQNFHCKECDMSFAWKSTLNKHIANNHRQENRQTYVCEICPKVYSTLSQVNAHVKRDHLKERNHVCPDCGKSFFKKFDLKTHCRTHTNERPYVCRLCGKGFHHRSHIIRHKRIHSGEKPYLCDICQKSFSQKGSLNAHRGRHKREKLDILEYQLDNDELAAL